MTDDEGRNLRKAERDEVDFCATMRRSNGSRLNVRVVNLSSQGFMARVEGIFEHGEPVLIELPIVGEVRAKVAWALGGRLGGQLDAAILPDAYQQLIAAAAARPRMRWPA